MKHIILYKDEFNREDWQEYCEILEVNEDSVKVKIVFNPKKVESFDEE